MWPHGPSSIPILACREVCAGLKIKHDIAQRRTLVVPSLCAQPSGCYPMMCGCWSPTRLHNGRLHGDTVVREGFLQEAWTFWAARGVSYTPDMQRTNLCCAVSQS